MNARRGKVAIPLSLHYFYSLYSVFQYVTKTFFITKKCFDFLVLKRMSLNYKELTKFSFSVITKMTFISNGVDINS